MEGDRPQAVDDVSMEEPSNTEGTESSQAPDDSFSSNISVDTLGAPTNACAFFAGDTLQRMVALHGRMSTVGEPGAESVRVRVPRDLEVLYRRRCSVELEVTETEAATAAPVEPEDTHHLTEWETLTRSLLTMHHCIVRLTLRISAVTQVPRRFYQGFSLRNGNAHVALELPAFANPIRDFLLPCMSHLCRLEMNRLIGIRVHDISPQVCDNLPQDVPLEEVLTLGLLQLNNDRLERILEATTDMPSLSELEIHLRNTGAGPRESQAFGLGLNRISSDEDRRLQCGVGVHYTGLLDCASANPLNPGELLRLLFCRELRGFESTTAAYVLTVARVVREVNDFLNIIITVRGRDEDDSH
ncbi:uncharacterized protein LOC119164394 [Rhipicephalus microplus]|uniref:uncharacterized protein LOC119164394 n=1 Tax=Rhipicephalus microplus TaxID=6941 RepID=UPI003F6A93CD